VARLSGARSAFIVHAIYPHPLSTNDALDRVALLGPCDMAIAVSDAARQAIGRLRPRVPNRLVHNGTPFHAVSPDQALSARGSSVPPRMTPSIPSASRNRATMARSSLRVWSVNLPTRSSPT